MGRLQASRATAGSLEPYAAGFVQWLADRGFSQSRIENRRGQFGHLGRWLEAEGVGPGELIAERQQRFLQARRAAGNRTWVGPQSLRLPLAYLREVGVVPAPVPVVLDGPVERLLADYRAYLAAERGLAAETICHCERVARLFLTDRGTPDGVELERLTASDVSAFLTRECPKRSISGARDLVMRLRSLLRYLHLAGVIEGPLQYAVPGAAYRRDHGLPRGLSVSAEIARRLQRQHREPFSAKRSNGSERDRDRAQASPSALRCRGPAP